MNISDVSTSQLSAMQNTPSQCLVFALGDEHYGVDILNVREIRAWSGTTRLPNTPGYLRGVMNLRGRIIPIFDLAARFGGEVTTITDKHVVVILSVAEQTIGLIVDAVSDILDIGAGEVKPAPAQEMSATAEFIRGILTHENRLIVLLDSTPLIEATAAESLAKLNQ